MRKDQRIKSKKPKSKKWLGKAFFFLILFLVCFSFGLFIGASAYVLRDIPDISTLHYGDWKSPEATLIYDRDGELLHRLFQENRQYVPLSSIPEHLQQATIAMEDSRFYSHHGIDFWSIPRALVADIRAGRYVQGFSTLTMQLARNVFLTQQKFLYRKIQEIFLALQFERMYTKDEILEFYLNESFMGHSAYGVQAAAQQYFGKNVPELSLAESALIIGLLPSPNRYSPYNNQELAFQRQRIVLNRMVDLGYITEQQAQAARNEELVFINFRDLHEDFAPYFVRHIRDQLLREYGPQLVYSGGLKVYTTLDSSMQREAENTVANLIESNVIPTIERADISGDINQPQMALISLDPSNGHVLAMIGGRGDDQWNRSIQSYRQPGSAFKPIIYTAAINEGYSPANIFYDYPTTEFSDFTINEPGGLLRPWPRNFNDNYHGPISLRQALADSQNVVAVKLLSEIGVSKGLEMAQNLGVSSLIPQDRNLGIALGGLTRGITLLEMAQAYSVFANNGILNQPISILRIEDSRGNILYQATPQRKIVLSEEVNYVIVDMLQSVITDGTGWRADLGRPAAGKTGTTNDFTDAWFVGFTPDIVTATWLGEDTLRSMQYNPRRDANGNIIVNPQTGSPSYQTTVGSGVAAQLWGDYMRAVVADKPITNFPPRPDSIINVTVDAFSGLLPNDYSPQTITDIFIRGNEPRRRDTFHQPTQEVEIDIVTGFLATSSCPADNIRTYTYQVDSKIRLDSQGFPRPLFDPNTGVPLKDENNNIIYDRQPEQSCWVHDPQRQSTQSSPDQNVVDELWESFFRSENEN